MNKNNQVNQSEKAAKTQWNKGRSFCSIPGTNQDRPDVTPHERQIKYVFLALFTLTTIIRVLLALYDHLPLTLTEQSSLLLSHNLFHGSLTFLTEPVHFGTILYSLILAPFTFISDSLLRLRLISAFNAVLLSSSLIPGYLLARRILKKPSHLILALLALSPNLLFSLSFMTENLYYPLLLWGFYAAYRFFTSETKKTLHAFLLGLLAFLLCFAHALGLAFAAALLVAVAAGGTGKQKSRKEVLLPPGLFLCGLLLPAALLKLTLFRSTCLFPSVEAVFAHFTNASELMYWLYCAFLFLLYFLITIFFFPAALPFCRRKSLSPANRSLLLLSGVYALCAALGASLVLSLRYDFADPYLTAYLRCLLGAGYPFLLLFLSSPEEKEPLTKKSTLLWLTVTYAALILLFLVVPRTRTGNPFDFPALQVLFGLDFSSPLWTWVCRGVPVLLAAAMLLWENKKGKQALAWALLPVMLLCEITGDFFLVRDARAYNTADPDLLAEAVRVEECLDTLEGTALVAASSANDPFLPYLAAVSDHDYAVAAYEDLSALMTTPEGKVRSKIALSEAEIPCRTDQLIDTYSLDQVNTVVAVGETSLLDPTAYEEVTPSGITSARVFRAADPSVLSLMDSRACLLGETITFYGPDATCRKFSPDGFSLPESDFTWSQAAEASLTLVPHVEEPCDLEFTWVWVTTNGDQPCQILANDTPVYDGYIAGSYDFTCFYVPAEAYAETGVLTLRFLFPDAQEPGNGDPRLLAVAFESLTMEIDE